MVQSTVTMLGSLPPIRGISSYCLELSRSVSQRCRVQFITYKNDKIYPAFLYPGGDVTDTTFPEYKTPNLQVIPSLTWYNPFTWLKEALKNRGDILHAQWWSLPLFPIYFTICLGFRLRKKPVILTVHNVRPHEPSLLFTTASRLLFKLCDHFVVHTHINKIQMRRHFGICRKHISVIPHGPLDFFHARSASSSISHVDVRRIRRLLNLPLDNKILLLFGAVRAYKGVDSALKAFAKLKSEGPDDFNYHLLIAGKMWEDWQPFEAFIRDHDLHEHVTVYPDYIPTDQVFRFFDASDLVLLPYKQFDSQSGVGTMATAFRKPMIVSRTGGLPDLVQNPKMIIPPGDSRALAKCIASVLSDHRILNALAQDASVTAQKISWEKIGQRAIDLYRKCIHDHMRRTRQNR